MPIGNEADKSKSQKTKGVVKGAVQGAQGKNAAGLAAGGQVTGALAGAGQALLAQTKPRTLLLIGAGATLGPFLALVLALTIISSLLGNAFSQTIAGADQAAYTSTGVPSAQIEAVQQAASVTPTPWTILEATIYYETGVGASVGQQRGVCPNTNGQNVLCPATLNFAPGTLTGGGGTSPQGSAPQVGPTSGFDPTVGRNGVVPALLAANAPDWTSTNTANWDCIRQAESGDNYTQTSGAYGILPSTWASLGLLGTPGQASKAQQNAVALEILNYEGHFYGAWNDLCTEPGSGPNAHIAFISPGVANPGGSAITTGPTTLTSSSGGACPHIKKQPFYYGPYCLLAGTLSMTSSSDLTMSSGWVAKQVGQALVQDGVGDSLDLAAGITLADSGQPIVDAGSAIANTNHTDIVHALAALPIEHNTSVLDENIYELAASWASGYSPTSQSTCSSSAASSSASLKVTGPNGSSDLLSASQVALARQIASQASSDGANSSTQVAALAAALALSNLSGSKGIFANGSTSVAGAISTFTKSATSGASPDTFDATIFGGSPSDYAGWISAAQQIVAGSSNGASSCGGSVPYVAGGSPKAQQAVSAAEGELGLPYVWGGGGSSGPSGSASAPLAQIGQPGFDCSGLVQYAFAQAGVSLPRTAQDQYNYVLNHSSLTSNIAQLQPGDLVFFSDNEPGVNHVAIYLGDDNIIQAPQTGDDVSYATLSGDMGLGFLGGGAAA